MFDQAQILQAQLALLQLAMVIDGLTPPESVAVAAKIGIEQARKHGYPIPPLAETLAEEGKALTKT